MPFPNGQWTKPGYLWFAERCPNWNAHKTTKTSTFCESYSIHYQSNWLRTEVVHATLHGLHHFHVIHIFFLAKIHVIHMSIIYLYVLTTSNLGVIVLAEYYYDLVLVIVLFIFRKVPSSTSWKLYFILFIKHHGIFNDTELL